MFSRYSIITTIVISGMMSLVPSVSALDVNQGTISSVETVCNDGASATSNEIWYVGSTFYPREVHYGDTTYDYLYGTRSTKVDVYNPNNYLQINGGFQWYSQIKPKGVSEVVAFQNQNGSKLVGHPTSPNEIAAQLVYRLTRVYSTSYSGGPQGPFVYTPVGGASQNYTYPSAPRWSTDVISGRNECVNIYARWCGDGIVDTNYETCDPNATGYSPTTCSPTTCTPIAEPAGNFDLSIKKYAKGEDVFASVDNTENWNYNIIVRNNGTGAVTGTTTVSDRLPAPITLRAVPSGIGWTCTGGDGATEFTCTTTEGYPANTLFNVITVPVRATSLDFRPTGYVNYAYVSNPQEADGKQCNANGSTPNPSLGGANGETPRAVCNEDANNFDPATVNPPNPNGFDLRLKKFVNGDDESSRVSTGGTAAYTFVLQNLGMLASTGTTTVTDTDFPAGISIASIQATQGEWTCSQSGTQAFTCTTTRSYAMGEYATPITLTANIGAAMTPGVYRNVACLSNPYDLNDSLPPYDAAIGYYKVNNCDPAEVVIVPPGSFDLSIKKYVGDITSGILERDGDHQTTNDGDGTDFDRDILTIPQGGRARYRFVVRNEGPETATGETTVEDTLPNGFAISATPTGTGWTCSIRNNNDQSFLCTRTGTLDVGMSFPEIVVDTQTTSTILAGEYSNIATVKNPGDTNPGNNSDPANVQIVVGAVGCGSLTGSVANPVVVGTVVSYTCSAANYTGSTSNLQYQINCGSGTGTWSSSNTGSCTAPSSTSTTIPVTCGVREATNTGVTFSGSFVNSCSTSLTTGGGGTPDNIYYSPNCVNNIPSCSSIGGTLAQCETRYGVGKCYSTFSACDVVRAGLVCTGGGGGGGSGGGPRCGDGVIQVGEECDVPGSPWCNNQCQLELWTNPGANPITDLWMTIPALSGTSRFGSSPFMRTSFSSGVVIGVGGKVFTLADTVGFGIKTQYTIPLMIEADKRICLQAQDNAIIGDNIICTTFGEAAAMLSNRNSVETFTKFPGTQYQKTYILLGKGDYQYQHAVNANYSGATSNSANDIDLFRGPVQYSTPAGNIGPTLNSAFQGIIPGRSNIALTLPESGIGLAYLPVRVSSAIVGTTGTPVNRSIESFVKTTPQSILAGFGIGTISNSTTTSATTNSGTTANTSIADISINGATEGSRSVSSLEDIPQLNGNPNILAIKGNLTIETCANNTFVMTGVRTVIVEGNLILKCNTAYPSNDTTSSWAWIVKGGNIQVYNGTGSPNIGAVTNLVGVYVAIGNSASTGRFEPNGATTTNAILKVDGSLYGNATPLFSSRLYARGTSAYDILTTGTIISYSNRALVNPPPLLSQYLNNYSVERVVK